MTESINLTFAAVGSLAAFVGALFALIKYKEAIKGWFVKRRKRREALDRLIDTAQIMKCRECNIDELDARVTANSSEISRLAKMLGETIKHNQRQDIEIDRSLNHRKIIDSTLFALVDKARSEDGSNTYINQAHEELREHLQEQAHKPISRLTQKGE